MGGALRLGRRSKGAGRRVHLPYDRPGAGRCRNGSARFAAHTDWPDRRAQQDRQRAPALPDRPGRGGGDRRRLCEPGRVGVARRPVHAGALRGASRCAPVHCQPAPRAAENWQRDDPPARHSFDRRTRCDVFCRRPGRRPIGFDAGCNTGAGRCCRPASAVRTAAGRAVLGHPRSRGPLHRNPAAGAQKNTGIRRRECGCACLFLQQHLHRVDVDPVPRCDVLRRRGAVVETRGGDRRSGHHRPAGLEIPARLSRWPAAVGGQARAWRTRPFPAIDGSRSMTRSAHVFYKWLGFVFAVLIAGAGTILGVVEEMPLQHVIFFTAATVVLVLWGWHHFSIRWIYGQDEIGVESARQPEAAAQQSDPQEAEEANEGGGFFRNLLYRIRAILIGVVLLIILFLILTATVDGFFTARNVFASIILVVLLALAVALNRYVTTNKSAYIGVTVLIGLFVVGSLVVDGFFSVINFKSMLVFAAFLGLACLGQTLVVLLGGLDLSIPFIIGSANIALAYLFGIEGLPNWLAVLIILGLGACIGAVTGFLSFRLQGQALIVSLGVGFAVAGGTQIVTSIGTRYAGNVHGAVPGW
ncbi:MAG: ABC transporter permease, partial [Rhodospirillaceae bacterium]|nr:ABC transporter permease [Rhodospirillaceae bacterium]